MSLNKINRFYGRRKGRKLSSSSFSALQKGSGYLINPSEFLVNSKFVFEDIFGFKPKKIILEIGFGSGENLIHSAKNNPEIGYIGADPFLNTNARCIKQLLEYNLINVKIWPDDVRQILDFFPFNIISDIKILFPDPWPKFKHKNRRIIQNEFLNIIYNILKLKGTITLGTDHKIMKSWILEIFQSHNGFLWKVKDAYDWRSRPVDCFETKYEQKSFIEKRKPSWFIFEKIN